MIILTLNNEYFEKPELTTIIEENLNLFTGDQKHTNIPENKFLQINVFGLM